MSRENEVEIDHGGRKRILRFNTKAIKAYERISGRSALGMIAEAGEAGKNGDNAGVLKVMSLSFLSQVIFSGLSHYEDRAITEDTVDNWLDGYNGSDSMVEMMNKIMVAIIAGFPSLKPKTNGAEVPQSPLA